MRTFSRLVRRYVAAAFVITVLVLTASVVLFGAMLIHHGNQHAFRPRLRDLSACFVETADGDLRCDAPRPLDEYGIAWAMVLSDTGAVRWRYRLPEELDRTYTVPEVASFSRWYLADYPVYVYLCDAGLLVCGMPRDSVYRWNLYMEASEFEMLSRSLPWLLAADGLLIVLACLLLSWRASLGFRAIGAGIDALARGEAVSVPQQGMTAELAASVNQAGALLSNQRAELVRRDRARTQWIAGVSHDIRTPLSLIFLHAEQIAGDASLTPVQRQRAQAIGEQGQRIRALIEDLNLTSKLAYDAQPLRRANTAPGALLRACAAAFVESAAGARCVLSLDIAPAVERLILPLDAALIRRAADNLLLNSARHNAAGCTIVVQAEVNVRGALIIAFADDGCGYPDAVLRYLIHPELPREDAPHILGLDLVRQIICAHGGEVAFTNEGGARCTWRFPVGEEGWRKA